MKWLGVALAALLLQGCMSMAFTGASMAYDRTNISKRVENQLISQQANSQIQKLSKSTMGTDVTATSYNNVILVYGHVAQQKLRRKIDAAMKHIKGVKQVINQIHVGPPPSFWQQTKDSWVTTKIKAKYMAATQIDPSKIKVITNDATVYLLGDVTREQAHVAIVLAQETDGVRKIVKIFRYITLVTA